MFKRHTVVVSTFRILGFSDHVMTDSSVQSSVDATGLEEVIQDRNDDNEDAEVDENEHPAGEQVGQPVTSRSSSSSGCARVGSSLNSKCSATRSQYATYA